MLEVSPRAPQLSFERLLQALKIYHLKSMHSFRLSLLFLGRIPENLPGNVTHKLTSMASFVCACNGLQKRGTISNTTLSTNKKRGIIDPTEKTSSAQKNPIHLKKLSL